MESFQNYRKNKEVQLQSGKEQYNSSLETAKQRHFDELAPHKTKETQFEGNLEGLIQQMPIQHLFRDFACSVVLN